MNSSKIIGAMALALLATLAFAQTTAIRIERPWARATVAGAPVGGGYATIRNSGASADRLVGVSSPVSTSMELHEMAMEKDVMRMREVKSLPLPAGGAVELKPGGYHLMFMGLKAPLKAGDKIPVTLRFEKAGEVKVEFAVESGASGAVKAAH